MKKLIVLLTLACLSSVAIAETPQEILARVKQEIAGSKAAMTYQAAAEIEVELANVISSHPDLDAETQDGLAYQIWLAYRQANINSKIRVGWEHEKLPEYIKNFSSSSSMVTTSYYNSATLYQASLFFAPAIRAAKNEQEFNDVLEMWFAENKLPERVADIRDHREAMIRNYIRQIVRDAIKLNVSESINWALIYYRLADNEDNINEAIDYVAQAIKAKDFNLTRANAFIESQNAGGENILSKGEMAAPAVLNDFSNQATSFSEFLIVGNLEQALSSALKSYRSAGTSSAIDLAILNIAKVLRAHDLNLVRANAFIEAQKNGTPFDLEL